MFFDKKASFVFPFVYVILTIFVFLIDLIFASIFSVLPFTESLGGIASYWLTYSIPFLGSYLAFALLFFNSPLGYLVFFLLGVFFWFVIGKIVGYFENSGSETGRSRKTYLVRGAIYGLFCGWLFLIFFANFALSPIRDYFIEKYSIPFDDGAKRGFIIPEGSPYYISEVIWGVLSSQIYLGILSILIGLLVGWFIYKRRNSLMKSL